jgi:hypothetical protein
MGFYPERLQACLPFFQDLDPAAGGEQWVHYKRDNWKYMSGASGAW